jgi:tetratricopeptide (TPR) repeat protein
MSIPSYVSKVSKQYAAKFCLLFCVFMVIILGVVTYPLIASSYHLREALVAKSYGDDELALKELDKAISLNPTSCAALDQRGQIYLTQGKTSYALLDFDVSLKCSPYNQDTLMRRAALLLTVGQYSRAIRDYDRVLELAPGRYNIYGDRALAYFHLKDFDAAIRDYSMAAKLAPQNAVLYIGRGFCYGELGQYRQALQDCQKAVELAPSNQTALLKAAWCKQRLGDLASALEGFNKAIKLNETNPEGFIYRGYCLLEQGNAVAALDDFNKAISYDGGDARSYSGRASAYEQTGQVQEALSDLAMVVSINPAAAFDSSIRSGAINKRLGDYLAAVHNFDQALKERPDEKVFLERAACYECLGDPERAVFDCNQALRLNANNSQTYVCRASYNHELGRMVSADKDFEKAVELDPGCYQAYLARGGLYLDSHEYEKALSDLNEADRLMPNNGEVMAKLALAKEAIKNNKSIAEHLINADDANSTKHGAEEPPLTANLETLLKFGYHQLFEGNSDTATHALARAVKKEPNDPRARRYLAYALLQGEDKFDAIKQFEALGQLGDQTKDDAMVLADALTSVDRLRDAVLILQRCVGEHPFDRKARNKLDTAQAAFEQCGGRLKLVTKDNCQVSPLILQTLAAAEPKPQQTDQQENNEPEQPQPYVRAPNTQG